MTHPDRRAALATARLLVVKVGSALVTAVFAASTVRLGEQLAPSPQALTAAFRERTTKKTYWALVKGVPRTKEGKISTWLAKEQTPDGDRMRVVKHGEADADHAVLRLDEHIDPGLEIVAHRNRHAEAEIDQHAGVDVLRGAPGDLQSVERLRGHDATATTRSM